MSFEIVILAAGQGTRMRSALPKVMHRIAGKPMLAHVIETARQLNPSCIHVVIGHGAEVVREAFGVADDLHFIVQEQQLGTGHAVAQVVPFLTAERLLVLYGDVPLIQAQTLIHLLDQASARQLSLLTVEMSEPTGYGRILRNHQGVRAIVEHKDATDEQLQIREVNTGILALPVAPLADWMQRLSNDNAQGEYYLTDVIALAVTDGLTVATAQPQDVMEVQGVNDRLQQAQLERYFQRRRADELLCRGVTLIDPARLDIRGEVRVGKDVVIDVNVVLEGTVVLEDDVYIGPNCVIRNTVLHRGAVVNANSHLDGAELGERSDAGPFARLRPGSVLGEKAHVGNFVELKNSYVGTQSKVGHLTYLGDAELGKNCNIGAGTITCNYDGAQKFRTLLGDDVFIGSNNSLVAPVVIAEGATTAAGSSITQDVPAHGLGVARSRQRNIVNWKRPQKKT